MRILVLADNFLPEIAAPSFRIRDHARAWLEDGHEVTVVTCAPNFPHGELFEGYKNRLYQVEWIDGVRVIRVWSYMTANRGFFKRTLDFVSFMAAAVFWCWRYPRCDVILATSPQFFTAVAGWLISLLRWTPWVFEVRDLWPESIRAVGASQGRLLDWLEWLELFLYRRANRVIALTESFRENMIGRGIRPEKIDVITNGVDTRRFDRRLVVQRQRFGLSAEKLLVGYVGTTGMAQGLATLVDAANLCRANQDIQFVIMGDGAEREQLEDRARKLGLANMRFAPRVPQRELLSFLAGLDLAVVHLRPDPLFQAVIPSKLFECMAMGLPILMAVEGESARIVEHAGCGVCIPSGDPDAMARAIQQLFAQHQSLADLGSSGPTAIQKYFSRDVLARAALKTLLRAAGRSDSTPGDEMSSPWAHQPEGRPPQAA